jgi:hypothetical protein
MIALDSKVLIFIIELTAIISILIGYFLGRLD